jgi:hypothetical protein
MTPTEWQLKTIDERTFKQFFPQANSQLFRNSPDTDAELVGIFLASKLWRLNNLYTIVDKIGYKRRFVMNFSQFYIYSRKILHPRNIILKSRQQGISTLFLIDFYDDMLTLDNLSVGMMAQDAPAAGKLLERVKLLEQNLDPAIKQFFNIETVKDNTEELGFSNGSTMYIRTSFRSATLQRLHVSEYGKIATLYPDKIKELKTGTMQAIAPINPVIIESTAEGPNDFKKQWDKSIQAIMSGLSPLDFQPTFLSWMQDPDCNLDFAKTPHPLAEDYFRKLGVTLTPQQQWFWLAKYEELGNDIFQEYPGTPDEAFQANLEGAYYTNEYKKLKLVDKAYDPNYKVHLAVDLGMNDDFPVGFFQVDLDGKVTIIGEYVSNNNGLEHYANVCKHLSQTRGWTFGITYVPHDVKVKELTSGKTRWETMRKLGFNPVLVRKHKLSDGIEQTRQFLKEVIVDRQCGQLLAAIQNYKKKFDKKFGIFMDEPQHDEYSHFADMLRYLAMGMRYSPVTASERTVLNINKPRLRLDNSFDI